MAYEVDFMALGEGDTLGDAIAMRFSKPTGTVKATQAPRYTSYALLMEATNPDEAF
jgi:hypothetical protein